jgi:hypothetical protein
MLSRIFGREQPKRDFPEHTDLPRFTEGEAYRAELQRLVDIGLADVYTAFARRGERVDW